MAAVFYAKDNVSSAGAKSPHPEPPASRGELAFSAASRRTRSQLDSQPELEPEPELETSPRQDSLAAAEAKAEWDKHQHSQLVRSRSVTPVETWLRKIGLGTVAQRASNSDKYCEMDAFEEMFKSEDDLLACSHYLKVSNSSNLSVHCTYIIAS
eukprot:COSAG01_NODE_4167_length_5275_cov_3.482032_1_plen_154_part_00